jgi:hypothetical protein
LLRAAAQHAAHQKGRAACRNQSNAEDNDALCVHREPLLVMTIHHATLQKLINPGVAIAADGKEFRVQLV